jgi:hypothetical protein
LYFLIFLWAGCLALAQPGLPACWLEARACELHPHFSQYHAETAHSHDYLFELATAQVSQGLPVLLVPLSLLLAELFRAGILKEISDPAFFERFWKYPVETPPPRFVLPS